jgi:hypothetical protein
VAVTRGDLGNLLRGVGPSAPRSADALEVRLALAIVGLGICAVYLRSARAAPAHSG